MGFSTFVAASLLALSLCNPAAAFPWSNSRTTSLQTRADSTTSYWVSSIKRQGTAAFGDSSYQIFRNVKDFGAVGDGTTDDTDAINKAVQSGTDRCLEGCDSRTTTPALVYFPPGTYLVSKPIIQSYYTQFVGDLTSLPTLKASSSFTGMAVIDADPYEDNGDNWYINQNNFFRQVRNFVIDITAMPSSSGACIHWQVAQATSLQNVVFNMVQDSSSANKQQGIFMDNGSGGFMTDLTFNGGGIGAFIGNQQYTTRNLTFNNCNTAIYLNWAWLWTMQDVTINNAQIGIDMSSGGVSDIQAGSFLLLDSKISNTPVGINTLYRTTEDGTNNTLIVDNVDFSDGVTTAIRYAGDNSTILAGETKVSSFAQGRLYTGSSGKAVQSEETAVTKPAGLLSNGKVFTRSKPQYGDVDVSKFVSVKSSGAKGDGSTDDTQAIQKIFDNATADSVIYFDHGAYIVTDTIKVPKSIKITGEIWPLIMASGSKFSDQTNPIPVFQVGEVGDTGDVEISDLIFETKGPAPGAILMQWNLAGSSAGSAGLWDVHFRVGGTAGTELQSNTCSKTPNVTTTADENCIGSFMMFHATKTASVYVENCWFWTADHELDLADHNQINIYNGRGVLIESQNPVWFWGTASEHSQLYNYQLSNAENTWLSIIQTETAYMQGNPDANTPFTVNEGYFDPDFKTSCTDGSKNCARTWGLRVTNSSDVFVFGGGLYSFFDNYNQDCLATESCQENMVSIESSDVHLFGISTKASVNMISLDGQVISKDADNRNTYCATVARFDSSSFDGIASSGSGYGSGSNSTSSGSSGSSSGSSSSSAPAAESSSPAESATAATAATAATSTASTVAGSDSGSGSGSDSGSSSGSDSNSGSESSGSQTTAAEASAATETALSVPSSSVAAGSDSTPTVVTVTATVTVPGTCTTTAA